MVYAKEEAHLLGGVRGRERVGLVSDDEPTGCGSMTERFRPMMELFLPIAQAQWRFGTVAHEGIKRR